MASWPATLPSPQTSGLAVSPNSQVIRTDMDKGTTRVRRITNAKKDKVAVSWKFTDAQAAIFRAWFDLSTGADGGAAWFSIDLATGYGGNTSVQARFESGVEEKLLTGNLQWIFSSTLEVRYA